MACCIDVVVQAYELSSIFYYKFFVSYEWNEYILFCMLLHQRNLKWCYIFYNKRRIFFYKMLADRNKNWSNKDIRRLVRHYRDIISVRIISPSSTMDTQTRKIRDIQPDALDSYNTTYKSQIVIYTLRKFILPTVHSLERLRSLRRFSLANSENGIVLLYANVDT